MTKTMYKVVYSNPTSGLESYLPSNIISYKLGIRAVPIFGKIFCFENLADALRFRNNNDVYKIVVGIGENPKRIKKISAIPIHDKTFWELHKNKKSKESVLLINTPKGTLVVDAFTPTEIVE